MIVGTTKHTHDTKTEMSKPLSVFLFVSLVFFVV